MCLRKPCMRHRRGRRARRRVRRSPKACRAPHARNVGRCLRRNKSVRAASRRHRLAPSRNRTRRHSRYRISPKRASKHLARCRSRTRWRYARRNPSHNLSRTWSKCVHRSRNLSRVRRYAHRSRRSHPNRAWSTMRRPRPSRTRRLATTKHSSATLTTVERSRQQQAIKKQPDRAAFFWGRTDPNRTGANPLSACGAGARSLPAAQSPRPAHLAHGPDPGRCSGSAAPLRPHAWLRSPWLRPGRGHGSRCQPAR